MLEKLSGGNKQNKHTAETFRQAIEDEDSALKKLVAHVESPTGIGIYDDLRDRFLNYRAKRALDRTESLYASGQKEAEALNAEYEHLHQQALQAWKAVYEREAKGAEALDAEYHHLWQEGQQALKALDDFEREKLGMHKDWNA